MKITDLWVIRWALVPLLAFKAFDAFFATVLTIAYRMSFGGTAEGLGRLTPGDDYTRLIPLMDAAPLWLHGLWVLSGVMYLITIAAAIRNSGRAHIPVLAAASIEIVAKLVGQPIIEATGVIVNPNPSVVATVVIPFILPLLMALVLWRLNPPSKVAAG